MDWKSIASKVMTFAPALAGAFLGPPGAALTAAAVALARSLGLNDDATPEQIDQLLVTDNPEIRLKVIAANQAFELEKRKLDLEEIRVVLADIQNARSRDVAIKQSGQKNVRADVLLALAFAAVLVIYFVCAYFGEVKLGSLVVGSMLTTVGTFVQKIGTAFDFEYGSSRSSIQKTEIMADAAKIQAEKK